MEWEARKAAERATTQSQSPGDVAAAGFCGVEASRSVLARELGLRFHWRMDVESDTSTPPSPPPRSLNRRTTLFLLLPSVGFLTAAIALIATGNHLQTELRKPLRTQQSIDAKDREFERRLSNHDPDLTPEKIIARLQSARRVGESWKDLAVQICGTMRTFGFLALVPIALQIYVVVRIAMQRQTRTE